MTTRGRPTCVGWHLISTEGEQLLARLHSEASSTGTGREQSEGVNPPILPRVDGEEPFRFQIALSFPGEHRSRVEKIALALSEKIGQKKVLYDAWHRAEFARPNLDVYLPKLYHEQSRLLVFFLCGQYVEKEWCGLEWRVGRDLLKRKEDDRLMFLRLDLKPIPGMYSIDGFIDISRLSDEQVARDILSRLKLLPPASVRVRPTHRGPRTT